jgi:hypothetical protein
MIDEEEATGELAEAYEVSASKNTGRVAHIYKIHSLNPRSLLDHRALYRTLLFGPSPLKRYQREMIGTLVSSLYDCHY